MDERISLVFSWDPRGRAWMRERGPEDAVPPPAEPIDDEAVQTYFLDPANGRWQATILGLRARQIANDLGKAYRNAIVAGLALAEQPQRNPRLVVESEGDYGDGKRRSRGALRLVGAAFVFLALIGGGAAAAYAFFGPNGVDMELPALTVLPTTLVQPQVATDPPVASATAAADTTNAAAPTVGPVSAARTTAPAPARTAGAITTVSYSTRLSNGTTITYTGPNAVVQQTALDMTFRVSQSNGQPAFDNLNVYVGNLGTAQAVTIQGDASGTYTTSMKITLPKGDQLLSVRFGLNGDLRTLGTISVR